MGLGLGLGRELGNDGIQVNILDNGVFETASNVGELRSYNKRYKRRV